MLPEAQRRDAILFDSDPAYDALASVFAPAANSRSRGPTHARQLASDPPRDRASRGAVVSIFALMAMLAGLAGLAASRYVVTPVRPTTPPPIVAKPALPPAPVATQTPAPPPVARSAPAAPAPIRLALSRPPSLPPITPRKAPRTPRPAPDPRAVAASPNSQRTPHLTGAALTRALAQDVIDTRKLNMGVLRDTPPSGPNPAQPTRQR